MLFEQLENTSNFTNSEKAIAKYLLEKPYTIKEMTAEDLGLATNTSKSSVFRFCKKINIKSFETLKSSIQSELYEKERMEKFRLEEPFNSSSTVKDILDSLPFLYDLAILHTNKIVNRGTISKIARFLRNADTIDFYASGITFSCAQAAAFKLQSIGKQCSVFTNFNEHYTVSMQNNKDKKISIILSFTGGNSVMTHCAKTLKNLGFYTIGIGGIVKKDLQEICDDFLEIYQKKLVTSFEFLTPYISMTYILDILFASIMVKDFDTHFKNSLKVRDLF